MTQGFSSILNMVLENPYQPPEAEIQAGSEAAQPSALLDRQ